MSKPRFPKRTSELPPNPRHPWPNVKVWEIEIMVPAAVMIARKLDKDYPDLRPEVVEASKKGRGRPKDVRAHLACHVMRGVYEEFTGMPIGRSSNKDGKGGRYYKAIETTLAAIGSQTDAISIIREQLYPGERYKHPFNKPSERAPRKKKPWNRKI
jgi:hypothetical protein